MEENREISYIVRMLLTTIGSYGIIRVLTSCALFQVSDMAVIFGILSAAVICVYGLYGRKKHFLIVTGIIFAGLSVLSFGILRAGFCHIYNDCMTALEKPYGLSLGRIAVKETAARPMQETIAVLFIAVLVTFAAAVIVIYLHSMLGTLLSILPLLILFVSLGAVPDSCTFFLCISYVLGVSALQGQKGGEQQSLMVLFLCLIALTVSAVVRPPVNYERFQVFQVLNEEAKNRFSWVGGDLETDVDLANGGINNGELGKIDGIRYSNRTLLTVTTQSTGKNQYFPRFIGLDYDTGRWSELLSSTLKNDQKENLVDYMDTQAQAQQYIENTVGSYYQMIKKVPYILRYTDGTTQNGTNVIAGVNSYSAFNNLLEYLRYEYLGGGAPLYKNMVSYQNLVKNNYLDVPYDVREVIENLLGETSVTTTEQKENYIKYVKDYLSQNYTYNMFPGKVPENEDFVKYFLTESKEGYCTYFATAAVLMYRCAGIPARYVEGYVAADDTIKSGVPIQTTQTRKTSDNVQTEENVVEYQVDLKDNAAHAWAEVYMDGYGWVTVEVTPQASAQGSTGAATEAGASSGEGQNIQQELQTESPSEVSTDGQELTQDAAGQPLEQRTDSVPEISQGAAGEADNTAQDDSSAGSTDVGKAQTESAFTRLVKQYPLLWIPIGLILLFTVMSAIILIRYFTVRQMRTAKKRKTDIKSMVQEERREMVMEAYRSFEKMLAAAGYGRTSGLEYEAYAGYLTEASEIFKENHIKRIFDLVLRCSFSEIPVSEQEYRGYRRDMQNIRNAIEQKLGFWERLYFKYIRLF